MGDIQATKVSLIASRIAVLEEKYQACDDLNKVVRFCRQEARRASGCAASRHGPVERGSRLLRLGH